MQGPSAPDNWRQTPSALPTVPHSGLGVASFVISASCLVLLIVVLALALLSGSEDPDVIFAKPGVGVAIMLGMVLLNLAPVVGLGLGIAGAVSKGRNRTYAVLGIVFNGLFLGLMVLISRVGGAN